MKTIARLTVLLFLAAVTGCGGDGAPAAAGDADVAVAADTAVEADGLDDVVAPADTAADSGADAPVPSDVAPGEDLGRQDVAPVCDEGAWECLDDAKSLRTCVDGQWRPEACWLDHALCEEGACVPQWRWGQPGWGTCPDVADATVETLAEKAAYYDDIAARLHVHPELKWIAPVELPRVEVDCPAGVAAPCYEPSVAEADATWADVVSFGHGENDGLWSALYLTAQAFRYAATGSEDALAMIRLLLDGEVARMEVTGVPGIFTREMIPPAGVPGVACPTDDAAYVTDVEKDDNRWVQIREDGCVWVIPNETMEWTKTDHCGLDDYAGWCFLDNVSQDEYAGHMLALGVLWKLVDVPDVRETVRDLLGQVGRHLYENDLTFVDWDGRVTEHGLVYPMALVNAPGYLAVESMNWVLMAAEASGDEELTDFYDRCLLQRGEEPTPCLPYPLQRPVPFTDHLAIMLLYIDGPGDARGCLSNWNNFSMMLANFHTLLWYELNPETAGLVQDTFDTAVMRPDHPLALINQENPWYNFIWAAMKRLGPTSDGPAYEAVEDGICTLRQFPASKSVQAHDSLATHEHFCDTRLDSSMAAELIPVQERCVDAFLLWKNPYRRRACDARPWSIEPPTDYLLAYWMGRYYGFIGEDM